MISKVVRWFLSEHITAKGRAIGIIIGILVALFVMIVKAHAFVMMDIIEFGHPLDVELVEPELRMFEWEHERNFNSSENREDSSRERETVLTDSDMGTGAR